MLFTACESNTADAENTSAAQTDSETSTDETEDVTENAASGAEETTEAQVKLINPVFSPEGCVFSGDMTVGITIPEVAGNDFYITYTTDGSEPTCKSDKYTGKIKISGQTPCTVIRAGVFDGSELVGNVVTQTYLRSSENNITVVSLVTDPSNLYSSSGILQDRKTSGKASERPVSIEIFTKDGSVMLRQDAGIRLSGAGSRSFDPASFRIVAEKSGFFDPEGIKYNGGGKFKADIFGDGQTEHDKLLLRNGGNDSTYQAREKFLRMNMSRDAVSNNFCAELEENLGVSVFAQKAIPAAVYLNGEFYAFMNLKEDFDEDLINTKFGLDKQYITALKGKKNGKEMYYKAESGNDSEISEWEKLCKFAADHGTDKNTSAAYEKIAAKLDIDNTALYFAVMTYLANTDWPQNNVMVWRYTGSSCDSQYADGKWRFIIRDMDLCIGLHDLPSRVSNTTYSMADTDTFERLLVFYWDGNGYKFDDKYGYYGDEMGILGLFDFLLRNEEFREKFKSYCQILSSDECKKMLENHINSYLDAETETARRHITLWKSKGKIYSGYSFANFESSRGDMLEFVSDRPKYFNQYLNSMLGHYE